MSSRFLVVILVCLAASFAGAVPSDEKKPDAKPTPARVDSHGDPLPPGAVVRLGTSRMRQISRPGGVTFSPDGKRVVTWGSGGFQVADAATGESLLEDRRYSTLAAWFGPDGKPVTVLESGGVTAAAYSPDGKTVAHGIRDGVNDGMVRVRDAATGKTLHELTGPTDDVRGLALSADGKTLARAGQKSVGLWDVATGKETRLFDAARDGSPCCAALSPDGKTLVTGEYFGKLAVWDVATGKERFAVKDLPFGYFPRAIAFAPDGKTFSHTGEGGVVFLRGTADGKEVRRFKTNGNTYGVAISPDGKTLAATVSQYPHGSETRVFDVETGKERFDFPRHELRVENVFYSADGKRVVTSGIDRTVRVWDAATGKHLFKIGEKKIEAISQRGLACALSPDSKTLLVARESVIEVWDTATGKKLRELKSPDGQVLSLSIAPTGKAFTALCVEANRNPERDVFISNHAVHVLDVETGKSSLAVAGLDAPVTQVVASPEGTLIAVGAPNALYRDGITLHTATGRKLLGFVRAGANGPVMNSFAISPDDKVLVASTADKLRFWDTASGDETKAFDAPFRASFFSLVYSPNGKYLAGSDHARFCVFEVSSGKVVWERPNATGDSTAPAFSPDGKRLAVADPNGTALIWELPGK